MTSQNTNINYHKEWRYPYFLILNFRLALDDDGEKERGDKINPCSS